MEIEIIQVTLDAGHAFFILFILLLPLHNEAFIILFFLLIISGLLDHIIQHALQLHIIVIICKTNSVHVSIKMCKNNKTGGSYELVGELLKYGGSGMIHLLHKLFGVVWREELVPPKA